MSRRYQLEKNIIVRLTSTGIALLCDYYICDRCDDTYGNGPPNINIHAIQSLKNGDKLFLNGFNIQNFNIVPIITSVLSNKKIKLNFYIGVIEPTIQPRIIDLLLPYAINIYITNNNHPQCKILPIGLRDGEEVHPNHKHFTGNDILIEMRKEKGKEYLCLMCFSTETHRERYYCEEVLKHQHFVMNLNNNPELKWANKGGKLINSDKQQSIHCGSIPQWIFYEYCHKSNYTLCPRGCGEDTHRFFEALALNSIPIVKKTNTPFDKTFELFPCLVVNEWIEITESLLLERKEVLINQMEMFHTKYPNFLTDKESIEKLLADI
jgi:hypothetical protein